MSEGQTKIAQLEQQIYELTCELYDLKRTAEPQPVPDYTFATLSGKVSLHDLFAGREQLLVIHNMGQACRYCTLWADGFNGALAHLEAALSVVLVSKDDPETQRRFANSRGWKFRLASHGGGPYIVEQSAQPGASNMPGAVLYVRDGGKILRKNACVFGPGDLYCPTWGLLALAGMGEAEWTPQFNYWLRPSKLEDGGENVLG